MKIRLSELRKVIREVLEEQEIGVDPATAVAATASAEATEREKREKKADDDRKREELAKAQRDELAAKNKVKELTASLEQAKQNAVRAHTVVTTIRK